MIAEPAVHSSNETAAGDDTLEIESINHAIMLYGIGLVLAAGLTIASFIAKSSGLIWEPALPAALIVFAIAQMGVHLVFFLHMTTGPDNANNALALAFGILIVILVMGGSLWIMANLNHNMLPMDQMIKMQR